MFAIKMISRPVGGSGKWYNTYWGDSIAPIGARYFVGGFLPRALPWAKYLCPYGTVGLSWGIFFYQHSVPTGRNRVR